MILSGSAVQEKGFGLSLVSATKRLMAAWSSTTHRKTPRFSRCFKFGEEALDSVEPRARGRREVEGETRVPVEPLAYLRMLMGGVVVEDDVHELSGGHLCLDSIEEADELLVTMALHAAANDLAFEDV